MTSLRRELKSSNILAVDLSPTDGVLVTFKSGATYKYPTAGRPEYEGMVLAPSPGKYFVSTIKPKHTGVKVVAEPSDAPEKTEVETSEQEPAPPLESSAIHDVPLVSAEETEDDADGEVKKREPMFWKDN